MNICLPPQIVNTFKGALKSGQIDPAKLADMTSEERHAFFSNLVGEGDALNVNSLFESKLLLKNQQQGYINWAKTVAGLKPEARRDLIAKIQKMDRVLNPEEEQAFLKDLAHTRLGVGVTLEEAKKITELSKRVEVAREVKDKGGNRLEYGLAKVELGNYLAKLKNDAKKMSVGDYAKHPGQAVSNTASLGKSLKASMDNSAIGRPGFKTLFTHPTIWARDTKQSFVDFAQQFGGKEVIDHVKADILSRPNADKYEKMGLGITKAEEAFPSQLPEKIPLLGRAYKASEAAYTGFQYRTRADLADHFLAVAEKNGVNINDKAQLQSIGKLVGSLTGRGYIGAGEKGADLVNNVFFSPRALKANLDTLTAHQFQRGVTPFVRRQAAIHTAKIIGGLASVLTVANAVKPGSVEFDPRSSDFGKIKVGDTRFDVSGGMASILTLATRIAKNSSKSGGVIKPLNAGYGTKSSKDVVVDFLSNKLSPGAAFGLDVANRKDRNGKPLTVVGEARNLLEPLPITNYLELKKDPNSANVLAATLADALGIATNTYGASDKDWSTTTSKELEQFKAKVGDSVFKRANADFNKRLDKWTKENQDYFRDLPNDQKPQALENAKKDIQDAILKSYGFKYKQPKRTYDKAARAAERARNTK